MNEHIVMEELEELLNQQLDCNGSTIKVTEMDGKKAVVKLGGACKGCPGAHITVNDMIEVIIKEKFPEIEEVILDTSCDEELLDFARSLLKRKRESGS